MLPLLEVHTNIEQSNDRVRVKRKFKPKNQMMSPDGWNDSTRHKSVDKPSLRRPFRGGTVVSTRQAALAESRSSPNLNTRHKESRAPAQLTPIRATRVNLRPSVSSSASSGGRSPSKSPVRLTSKEAAERRKRQRHLLKHICVVKLAARMETNLHNHRRERAMSLWAAHPVSVEEPEDKTSRCISKLKLSGFGEIVQTWKKKRASEIMKTFLNEFSHDVVGVDNRYGVGLHTIRLAIFKVKKVLCKVQRGIRSFVIIQAARRKLLARKWVETYRKNQNRLDKFNRKLYRDWKRRQQAPPETPWIADQMKQMNSVRNRATKMLAEHEKRTIKLIRTFATEERERIRKHERSRSRSRTDSSNSVTSSVLLQGLDTQRSLTSLLSTTDTLSRTSLGLDIDTANSTYGSGTKRDLPYTNAQRDQDCKSLLTETRRRFFIDCISGSEKMKAEKQSALEKASGNAAYNIEDAHKMVSQEGYLEEQLGLKRDVHILDANKWPPFLVLSRVTEKEILKRICKAMLDHFNSTHDVGNSTQKSKFGGTLPSYSVPAPWPRGLAT